MICDGRKALHTSRRPVRSLLLTASALCWLAAVVVGAWAFDVNSGSGKLLPELRLDLSDTANPALAMQTDGTGGIGTVPVLGQLQLNASGSSKLNLKAFTYVGQTSGPALGLSPMLGLQGLPGESLGRALGLTGTSKGLSPDDRATQVRAEYGTTRAKFAVGFTDVGVNFPKAATALQGINAADLEALKKAAGLSNLDLSGMVQLGAANLTSTRTTLHNDKPGDSQHGLTTTDWVNTLALNLGKSSALKMSLSDHDESWDPGLGKQGSQKHTTQIAWDTTFGKGGLNSIKLGLTDSSTTAGGKQTSEKTQEIHLALAPDARLRLNADYVTKGDGGGKSTTTSTFGTVLQLAAGSELTANLQTTSPDKGKESQQRYLKLTSDLGHGTSLMKLFAEQKLVTAPNNGGVANSKLELTGGLGRGDRRTNLHVLMLETRGEGATGKLERTATIHLDQKLGKRLTMTADHQEAVNGTLGKPAPTAQTAVTMALAIDPKTTLTAGLSSQETATTHFTSQDVVVERKVGSLLLRGEDHRRDDPSQTAVTGYMMDLPMGKLPAWVTNISRKHEFSDIYDYFVAREPAWLDLPFAGFRFWAQQRRGGPDHGLDTRVISYRTMLTRRFHLQFTSQNNPEAEAGPTKGRPDPVQRQYVEIDTPVTSGMVGRGWMMDEKSTKDAKDRRHTLGLGVTGKLSSDTQTEVDFSQTQGYWEGKPTDLHALAMLYAHKIDEENQVAVKIACAWGEGTPADPKNPKDLSNPEYRVSLQYNKPI